MTTILNEAHKYLGLTESKDYVKLNTFLKTYQPNWGGLDVRSTPWCSAFINALCVKLGIKGTNSFLARSFLKWGKRTTLDEAREGDIMVFTRAGSTWQGHVAIFTGRQDKYHVEVLGGNQNNSVCVKQYDKTRLLGIRRII